MQEIETKLGVGYAVRLLDMNGDSRPDIVVVDQERLVWYENPTWRPHAFAQGLTKKDNVCFAPYDIDGDGKRDFALGADWRPGDTVGSGTLQWISPGASPGDPWQVHPIGQEPTIHRIRWADFDGDGRKELIVAPLFGRGTSSKNNWQERPIRILSYKIPADPARGPWTPEIISEELHVAHNLWPTDLDDDGRLDLLVASYEGVSLLQRSPEGKWSRKRIGAGNQEAKSATAADVNQGKTGASEIKVGRLASGQKYIATIEPWHGFQVVVYTPPKQAGAALWDRHVLDDQLKWGHAVWPANIDDDKDEELIIGVRDNRDKSVLSGVRIYDRQDNGWRRTLIDPGGVAVEDLIAGDLNGDGKADIVAVGRATHNVRIYWNK